MRKIESRIGRRQVEPLFVGIVMIAALALTDVPLVSGQVMSAEDTGRGQYAAQVKRVVHDRATELAMRITDPFTFVAVGDLMMQRSVAQLDDPGFQDFIKMMRTADMTYANFEGVIVPMDDPNWHGRNLYTLGGGDPAHSVRETYIDDLKYMGVRVVSTGNNHNSDCGPEALNYTNRLLDEARIIHAGSGKDLMAAEEPGVGGTSKGTVGLVSILPFDPYVDPERKHVQLAYDGTAGVNPLRVTPYYIVSADEMSDLRKIRDDAYTHRSEVRVPVPALPANESPDKLSMFGGDYMVGEKTGALSYRMNEDDLDRIMKSIRFGKQETDFLIVAVHCHQNSFAYQAYSHDNSTPDFLVTFAHMAIDNGADVFVGTGVHSLRGVEIYKGKPIFYNLSSWLYEEDPIPYITDPSLSPSALPADRQEVLMTSSRYEGGKLVEVRLYPGDTGIAGNRPVARTGIPTTPSPEDAQRILKYVQKISEPFGTKISIENNVGIIHVAQKETQ